jgi:hypothetical protein
MAFSSETIDSSPSSSFRQRLADERKVNVYFIPGKNKSGEKTFLYALASAALHEQFIESVKKYDEVPDFAVIVENGIGDPTPEIKAKIKSYYGFDHDLLANNDNVAIDTANAASA